MRLEQCIVPEWPAPAGVRALVTTRRGGVSNAPYDSFNVGCHVGDDPELVSHNRAMLRAILPSEPVWLEQVHGIEVVDADIARYRVRKPTGDAAASRLPGTVCVVMTADCLPVLLTSRNGLVVGAVHAGWRGLLSGVIEAAVTSMGVAGSDLLAYLGPAIGPAHFEVGPEVRESFMRVQPQAQEAFRPGRGDRWLANIFELARQRLRSLGMPPESIYGGQLCTVSRPDLLYSYRRDGVTGRMASLIWRELI